MKAAFLNAYKEPLTVAQTPSLPLKPGEVRIKVLGAGICHSDLHLWTGEVPAIPSFPWILGHEVTGEVSELGPGVTDVPIGMPVAVYGGWGCGKCSVCLQGEEQLCNVGNWLGIGVPGGWAEELIVPSVRHLVPLGELNPVKSAPLTDAALTPYRAVKRALPRMEPGSAVVSIGVGGLGQFGLQYAKRLSAAAVVAVDSSKQKRDDAWDYGADYVVDPTENDDCAQVIRKHVGSRPITAIFDYVGSDSTLALAASLIAKGGLIQIVGLGGGTLGYNFLSIAPEAEVMSSYWGTRTELAEVISLAHDGLIHEKVQTYALGEINQALSDLREGKVEGRAVIDMLSK